MRLNSKKIWCVFYSSDINEIYDNEEEALIELAIQQKHWPHLKWQCKPLDEVGFQIWSIGNHEN